MCSVSVRDSTVRDRAGYGLFASLYTTQFLGTAFFSTALASILRDRGVPLDRLGWLQAALMISALRVLWAPVVDRIGAMSRGHYRMWLLVLQPLMAMTLAGLALVEPVRHLDLVLLAGLVTAALSATQDIAVDSIAVRLLRPEQHGVANGIQVAGGYVGSLVGGGVSLLVYDRWGWTATVLLIAALSVVPLLQLARLRETGAATALSLRARYVAMFDVARLPRLRVWTLAVQPCCLAGIFAAYSLVGPMLVDAGWSLSEIGWVTSIAGDGVAIGGAVVAGVVVARVGAMPSLVLFGLLQVAAVLGLLPLAFGGGGSVSMAVAILVFKVAYAASATVIGTVSMRLSRPELAGTDYSAMATAGALVAFGAGAVALWTAETVGYPATLLTSAGLALTGVLAVRWVRAADS
ncbi:MFS transporter [Saccharomonospora xinjiangensis]|nr:muropeptide transporter [Saccharomonospora xinjiangensis]